MEKYGSDKPDMRYELLIHDYKELLSSSVVPLFSEKNL